jgi:hypothetical protein
LQQHEPIIKGLVYNIHRLVCLELTYLCNRVDP